MPLEKAMATRDTGVAVVFSLNASMFGVAEQARFRSRIATAGAIPVDRVVVESIGYLNRLVNVAIRPSQGGVDQASSEAVVRKVETALAWNEDALEFDVTIVSIARLPASKAPPIVDIQTSANAADDSPEVFSPTYRAVLLAAAMAFLVAGSVYAFVALRRSAQTAGATAHKNVAGKVDPSPQHTAVSDGTPVKIKVSSGSAGASPASLFGDDTPSPKTMKEVISAKSEYRPPQLSPVSPPNFANSDDADYIVSV